MTGPTIRALLAAGLILAGATAASAQGNSNSGSGLSPNAGASGNDRSAGVNNGNNRLRGYGYARRGGYERPVYDRYERRRRGSYYGYPY